MSNTPLKVFVSYARVDQAYCSRVIKPLEHFDVWYDQRMEPGAHWWKEILDRLYWADVMVYLLSPDSVTSPYCLKEFEIAQQRGIPVLPVLIDGTTKLPKEIGKYHYIDLERGVTIEGVTQLLTRLFTIEKERGSARFEDRVVPVEMPAEEPDEAVAKAVTAMRKAHYDKAVFLLRQARLAYETSLQQVDQLLVQAEAGLDQSSSDRELRAEYQEIATLLADESTWQEGCRAFAAFHREHPGYDPSRLAERVKKLQHRQRVPMQESEYPFLEWVFIPAGDVLTPRPDGTFGRMSLPAFYISRYPVTNALFERFVSDPHGYRQPRWWQYSPHAAAWHERNPKPAPPAFPGDALPRENVCWYEAYAMTQWLTYRLKQRVRLPQRAQWRRAAQGNDMRLFPWGDEMHLDRCNVHESQIRTTTPVNRYQQWSSPFGVVDMVGNVWEWCLDVARDAPERHMIRSGGHRAVCGGSFNTKARKSSVRSQFYLTPDYYYNTVGFRLIMEAKDDLHLQNGAGRAT
jgi:formylglycine-generating enzyme required for sulfatase activity